MLLGSQHRLSVDGAPQALRVCDQHLPLGAADLFVSVLERAIARELTELAEGSRRPVDLAVRAATRLQRYRLVITAVHERARVSSSVAEFHDRYHRMLDQHLAPRP
jgi:hypothetical protein